ncbi:MAG: hypothetical protein ACRD4B_03850, partial [Acidobacteriota bacterium]
LEVSPGVMSVSPLYSNQPVMMRHSAINKLVGSLVLFGIAALFSLCLTVPLMSLMDMESNGPCGMDHATELCSIMLSEHIGFWQKILVPAGSSVSLLSLLVILVVVVSLKDTAALEAVHRLKFRRYNADITPPLVDYLKRQLFQGILHPKIY